MVRRVLIATCLGGWAFASCTPRPEESRPDAQAVVDAESVDAKSPVIPIAPSAAASNAAAPVDAGPCVPTPVTSAARLVCDVLPCDGACPVYRVTLHGDGVVEYDGTEAKITGHHESKIARKATDALFAQAECGTFAVPAGGRGGSGMYGPSEAVITLDVGKGPRTLRAQRAHTCAVSLDPQDRAVCELSYAMDEAVHVDTWIGYLPRNAIRALARDH